MIKYNENNINDWYFADDNIVKVYKGLQYTSRLPQGYTEVEYVENTTMAYLNLDVIPYSSANNSYIVQSRLSTQWSSIGGDWEYLISTEQGNQAPYNGFTYRWDKYNKPLGLYFDVIPNNTASFSSTDNGDGTSSITISCSSTNATNTTPITLFCGLQGATVWRNGRGRFYSFKLTLNDNVVRDLVPCKRDSDDMVGMYDIVNDVFYAPNNGNLVAGSAVTPSSFSGRVVYQKIASGSTPPSPSGLPSGYTEVEYVENTTQAYIDTNLQIYSSTTNSFEVETKLIGARHDGTTYQNVFTCMSEDGEPYQGFVYRYVNTNLQGNSIPNGQNTFTVVNNSDSTKTVTVVSSSSQRTYTHIYPLTLFCGLNSSRNPFRFTNSKFYYLKVKMNDELILNLIPCKRDSDDMVGMYDIVNDVFYYPPNYTSYQLVAGPIV